jgi:hypothetical protein
MSIYDAEQQKLDEQLDKQLNPVAVADPAAADRQNIPFVCAISRSSFEA